MVSGPHLRCSGDFPMSLSLKVDLGTWTCTHTMLPAGNQGCLVPPCSHPHHAASRQPGLSGAALHTPTPCCQQATRAVWCRLAHTHTMLPAGNQGCLVPPCSHPHHAASRQPGLSGAALLTPTPCCQQATRAVWCRLAHTHTMLPAGNQGCLVPPCSHPHHAASRQPGLSGAALHTPTPCCQQATRAVWCRLAHTHTMLPAGNQGCLVPPCSHPHHAASRQPGLSGAALLTPTPCCQQATRAVWCRLAHTHTMLPAGNQGCLVPPCAHPHHAASRQPGLSGAALLTPTPCCQQATRAVWCRLAHTHTMLPAGNQGCLVPPCAHPHHAANRQPGLSGAALRTPTACCQQATRAVWCRLAHTHSMLSAGNQGCLVPPCTHPQHAANRQPGLSGAALHTPTACCQQATRAVWCRLAHTHSMLPTGNQGCLVPPCAHPQHAVSRQPGLSGAALLTPTPCCQQATRAVWCRLAHTHTMLPAGNQGCLVPPCSHPHHAASRQPGLSGAALLTPTPCCQQATRAVWCRLAHTHTMLPAGNQGCLVPPCTHPHHAASRQPGLSGAALLTPTPCCQQATRAVWCRLAHTHTMLPAGNQGCLVPPCTHPHHAASRQPGLSGAALLTPTPCCQQATRAVWCRLAHTHTMLPAGNQGCLVPPCSHPHHAASRQPGLSGAALLTPTPCCQQATRAVWCRLAHTHTMLPAGNQGCLVPPCTHPHHAASRQPGLSGAALHTPTPCCQQATRAVWCRLAHTHTMLPAGNQGCLVPPCSHPHHAASRQPGLSGAALHTPTPCCQQATRAVWCRLAHTHTMLPAGNQGCLVPPCSHPHHAASRQPGLSGAALLTPTPCCQQATRAVWCRLAHTHTMLPTGNQGCLVPPCAHPQHAVSRQPGLSGAALLTPTACCQQATRAVWCRLAHTHSMLPTGNQGCLVPPCTHPQHAANRQPGLSGAALRTPTACCQQATRAVWCRLAHTHSMLSAGNQGCLVPPCSHPHHAASRQPGLSGAALLTPTPCCQQATRAVWCRLAHTHTMLPAGNQGCLVPPCSHPHHAASRQPGLSGAALHTPTPCCQQATRAVWCRLAHTHTMLPAGNQGCLVPPCSHPHHAASRQPGLSGAALLTPTPCCQQATRAVWCRLAHTHTMLPAGNQGCLVPPCAHPHHAASRQPGLSGAALLTPTPCCQQATRAVWCRLAHTHTMLPAGNQGCLVPPCAHPHHAANRQPGLSGAALRTPTACCQQATRAVWCRLAHTHSMLPTGNQGCLVPPCTHPQHAANRQPGLSGAALRTPTACCQQATRAVWCRLAHTHSMLPTGNQGCLVPPCAHPQHAANRQPGLSGAALHTPTPCCQQTTRAVWCRLAHTHSSCQQATRAVWCRLAHTHTMLPTGNQGCLVPPCAHPHHAASRQPRLSGATLCTPTVPQHAASRQPGLSGAALCTPTACCQQATRAVWCRLVHTHSPTACCQQATRAVWCRLAHTHSMLPTGNQGCLVPPCAHPQHAASRQPGLSGAALHTPTPCCQQATRAVWCHLVHTHSPTACCQQATRAVWCRLVHTHTMLPADNQGCLVPPWAHPHHAASRQPGLSGATLCTPTPCCQQATRAVWCRLGHTHTMLPTGNQGCLVPPCAHPHHAASRQPGLSGAALGTPTPCCQQATRAVWCHLVHTHTMLPAGNQGCLVPPCAHPQHAACRQPGLSGATLGTPTPCCQQATRAAAIWSFAYFNLDMICGKNT